MASGIADTLLLVSLMFTTKFVPVLWGRRAWKVAMLLVRLLMEAGRTTVNVRARQNVITAKFVPVLWWRSKCART